MSFYVIRQNTLPLKKYSHSDNIPTLGFNCFKISINFQIRAGTLLTEAKKPFMVIRNHYVNKSKYVGLSVVTNKHSLYINRFSVYANKMAHGIQITFCTYIHSNLTKIKELQFNALMNVFFSTFCRWDHVWKYLAYGHLFCNKSFLIEVLFLWIHNKQQALLLDMKISWEDIA